jgi:hypothetical protein
MGWRQVQMLYWQRKASAYTAPSDQVVLDATSSSNGPNSNGVSGSFVVVPVWERFNQAVSPGRRRFATLFMHERTNSKGEPRVVVIEAEATTFGAKFIPIVIRPGSIFRNPEEVPDSGMYVIDYVPGDSAHPMKISIYAGQPDSIDASHFSINYVAGGIENTIDGWLRDDDRIEFMNRPRKTQSH